MAVLKSPRNTRNKKNWSVRYSRSFQNLSYKNEDRKLITGEHKMHLFLQDAIRWTREPSEKPRYLRTGTLNHTVTMLMYGSNTFNSLKAHPYVLCRQLKQLKTRRSLTSLVNSKNLF